LIVGWQVDVGQTAGTCGSLPADIQRLGAPTDDDHLFQLMATTLSN
jgi:hypothetical protein